MSINGLEIGYFCYECNSMIKKDQNAATHNMSEMHICYAD